jgi:hypothetical protein
VTFLLSPVSRIRMITVWARFVLSNYGNVRHVFCRIKIDLLKSDLLILSHNQDYIIFCFLGAEVQICIAASIIIIIFILIILSSLHLHVAHNITCYMFLILLFEVVECIIALDYALTLNIMQYSFWKDFFS